MDTKYDTWTLNSSKWKPNNWELGFHGVPHFWLQEVKRFDNYFSFKAIKMKAPVHKEIYDKPRICMNTIKGRFEFLAFEFRF